MSTDQTLFDRALAAAERGDREEARALYDELLEHGRTNPVVLANHAAVLASSGEPGSLERAVVQYRAALEFDPSLWQAWNNLGNVYRELGRLDDALTAFGKATDLVPAEPDPWMNFATALKDAGLLRESVAAYQRSINLRPTFAPAHSNYLFALLFHPTATAQTHLGTAREWDARHAAALTTQWRGHSNDLSPGRRLRVGYVGADFRSHAQANFTIPLFRHHDGGKFHLHVYASVLPEDGITDQHREIIASKDGVWVDVLNLSDEALAARVRQDRIDILIDLTMHMSGSRLLTFARKPAPVQLTYLAYPGTTGLRAMNYRLTDPYLDPPGWERFYAEASIRLPETFWCYEPLSGLAPGPIPALAAGHVTFGCLNNFCKVSDAALALFARVLGAVPTARLMLLAGEGAHRARLLSKVSADVASRVVFVSPCPRAEYLALYRSIDISLDTIPYNGHTTSLDSLWMGVPVVTRVGGTVVGRAGVSQLTNLSLTELIATTDEAYVEIARGLAGDLTALAALRAGLRPRMEASPLMDARRFTAGFEEILGRIWAGLCRP